MIRLIGATLLVLMLAAPQFAAAYTCTGTTCTDIATYTEPTTCTSGVLLGTGPGPPLQETNLLLNVNGGPTTTIVVPATQPGGGGNITQTIAGIPVPPCTKVTHNATVIARSAGGVSVPTPTFSLVLDRTVLPGTTTPDPSCVTSSPITNLQVN